VAGKGSGDSNFISDRSGFKCKRKDMVVEPGTGIVIHRDESDGIFNLVDHPVNHVNRLVKFNDPKPVDNVRLENYSKSARDSLPSDWPTN